MKQHRRERTPPVRGRALTAAALVVGLTAVGPGNAQGPPAEIWKHCLRSAPEVNAGSLALQLVAEQGPSGGGVFTAEFPGGWLQIDGEAAIELELARRGMEDALAVSIRHEGASAPDLELAGPATGAVRDADTGRVLEAFGAVTAAETYPGISVRFGGRNRTLDASYTVAPGADPGIVAVRYASAGELRPIVSGYGKIELEGGTAGHGRVPRRLRLHPPKAHQGDDEVAIAQELDAAGRVRFTIGEYDPSLPLEIETTVEHSRFFAEVVTAWGPGGDSVVLADVGAGPAPRAFVQRLDASGRWIEETVLLGSDSGAASVTGLAVDDDGAVYLAGELAGKAEGYAAIVDGGEVRAFRTLSGLGAASPRAVLVDGGRILVAAELLHEEPLAARPVDELRAVLPAGDGDGGAGEDGRLVVAELAPELDEVVAATTVEGPVIGRPRLWIGCDGVLTAGLATQTASTCALQELKIKEIDLSFTNGYANYPEEWGHFLLQWKQFHASYLFGGSPSVIPGPGPFWTTIPFTPAAAAAAASPPPQGAILDVGIGAAQALILNGLEASSAVYPNGNPPGGWGYGDAFTLPELAIAAGLYIDKVSSPLACRLNIGGAHRAAVVTAVEYCIEGGVYSTIQDLIPGWVPQGTWDPNGNPLDVVDSQWATIYGNSLTATDWFEVESLKITHWPGSGWTAILEDDPFAGAPLDALFDPPFVGASVATDWVADPPDTAPGGSGIVRELSSRLAGRVLVPLDVDTVIYSAGKPDPGARSTARARRYDLSR
jgi:hypothetical protein